MKFILPFITVLIVATLSVAIATFSMQNATPISLKFFGYQSIEIALGLILTVSFAIGAIVAATLHPISTSGGNRD